MLNSEFSNLFILNLLIEGVGDDRVVANEERQGENDSNQPKYERDVAFEFE